MLAEERYRLILEAVNKNKCIQLNHSKFDIITPVHFLESNKARIITDKITNKTYLSVADIKEVL